MSDVEGDPEATTSEPEAPRSSDGLRDLSPEEIDNLVLYQKVERLYAVITFNRPERLKAMLAPYSFEEFARKIQLAEDDDEIKVIILTGAVEDSVPALISDEHRLRMRACGRGSACLSRCACGRARSEHLSCCIVTRPSLRRSTESVSPPGFTS